jgi:lipoate---protein ligase
VSAPLRAVDAGTLAPEQALALDEAMVRVRPAEPALLLWRTSPAVVIGRFQRADWEIDAAACARRGVHVWRRFTGGGAVYLDPGTLCVGLVAPAGHPWAALEIPALYAPLLDGIVAACARMGVEATRDERTVRVGGRKVTGIAAHRGRYASLVHGTLLLDADLDALRACLAGPRGGDLAGAPKPSPSRPDHVANIGDGSERAQAIVDTFGGVPGELTRDELATAESLAASRYRDRAWHAGHWAAVTPEDVLQVLGGGGG